MKLSDVANTLQSGELNNLSLFGDDGKLVQKDFSKIITSINLGLTDLHTRFLLKLGRVFVNVTEGQVQYPLKAINQLGTRAPASVKQFISAEGDKLNGDLLKVQQVIEHGRELGINDFSTHRSVNFTQFDVMNVPSQLAKELDGKQLEVVYRKNAVLIGQVECDCDYGCVDVDLDYTHLWALCLFIASRLHTPSGFGTGGVHEGNNYFSKYLAEVDRLNETNMRLDYQAENVKGRQKGFP